MIYQCFEIRGRKQRSAGLVMDGFDDCSMCYLFSYQVWLRFDFRLGFGIAGCGAANTDSAARYPYQI
jgi:hypothetical protein